MDHVNRVEALHEETRIIEKLEDTVFYALRLPDGRWYRPIGGGSYDRSWTHDFKKARIYLSLRVARTQATSMTRWSRHNTIPTIVCFHVNRVEELHEETRIIESMAKNRQNQARIEAERERRFNSR